MTANLDRNPSTAIINQTLKPEPAFLKQIHAIASSVPYTQKLSALFTNATIENAYAGAKRKASIKVRVARNNNNIFVSHSRKPIVVGYINPITELLVCENITRDDLAFDGTRESINFTPHHQFQMLAVVYAAHAFQEYITTLNGYSVEELQAQNLKPTNQIIMELNEYLQDGMELYKDISNQLVHLVTAQVPQANHFVAYSDEASPKYLVTDRLPYPNPMGYLDMDTRLVERFLDAFLEESDKARLSWYFGAALRNLPVYDFRVSKMLMVASAKAGSGKSTLITTLTRALFTNSFSNIMGDFDSNFRRDNRFTTANILNTRMNVYLESDFGIPGKDGNLHDFSGLNLPSIKSMITDGYIAIEPKYEERRSGKAFGFHIAITNHPAVINDENEAMSRRILPVRVKPTAMEEKAKALGLIGQEQMDRWVEDHALEFAVYFVREHMSRERQYQSYLYNSTTFKRELFYTANKGLFASDPVLMMSQNKDNIFIVMNHLKELHGFDVDAFIADLQATDAVVGCGDIRVSGGKLYLNSSTKYLSAYTEEPDAVRDVLIELYGAPEKKFQKNRFIINFKANDLVEYQTHMVSQSVDEEHEEIVEYTVVGYNEETADMEDVVLEDPTVEELAEEETQKQKIARVIHREQRYAQETERKPKYMDKVKPEDVLPEIERSTDAPLVVFDRKGNFKSATFLNGKSKPKVSADNARDVLSQLSDAQRQVFEANLGDVLSQITTLQEALGETKLE